MINPDEDNQYYVTSTRISHSDFEGITFDPVLFQTQPHFYVIDEGRFDLIRYSYKLSLKNEHILYVTEECRTSLKGAMPCHPKKWGVESLTLYRPSSPGVAAEFLIGLQKGLIYRVDATGI